MPEQIKNEKLIHWIVDGLEPNETVENSRFVICSIL